MFGADAALGREYAALSRSINGVSNHSVICFPTPDGHGNVIARRCTKVPEKFRKLRKLKYDSLFLLASPRDSSSESKELPCLPIYNCFSLISYLYPSVVFLQKLEYARFYYTVSYTVDKV